MRATDSIMPSVKHKAEERKAEERKAEERKAEERKAEERFLAFAETFIAFMESPASAALAAWVQAIILILTLLYVRGQLTELVKQNQMAKGTKLYELVDNYQEHLAPQMEKVRRLGWRSRERFVSTDEFLQELSAVDVKTTLHEYLTYEYKLKTCADNYVCNEKLVSEFLCEDTKSTYLALFHNFRATRQPEWKKLPLTDYQFIMTDYINDYCALGNRTHRVLVQVRDRRVALIPS